MPVAAARLISLTATERHWLKKAACGHKTEYRLRVRAQIVLHTARGLRGLPGAEDRGGLAAQPAAVGAAEPAAVEAGRSVTGAGVDQGDGDRPGVVVVAGARVCAFHERADAHGGVESVGGRPGPRVAYGGEHRTELVGGLVHGGEGAGSRAAAGGACPDSRGGVRPLTPPG
ncbi:hypothetical protein ACIBCB_10380 [Streptomyces uncialis]|uniref:hypothetical protein n=1 Tax=Streptomyces uncialis TaxID=1048205 RepID=UPI00378D01CD